MSLDEKFNKAAEAIRTMTTAPSDDEMKEIYALYKQSTVGDVNTARPGMLDLKGKAKWDSWEAKKGMSFDVAKEAYVSKTEELVTKYISASSA
ncbi:acyl-CoA-binding protein homolog [Daphnia pulex]|uniref:acyl-CoA-binding protein homolog n=1 Tax=Daphnia pulex TaxID=6669 RepID=UPI001EDF3616|nr:acyl-CoA-binding protein homolog [Daphnia pulex]